MINQNLIFRPARIEDLASIVAIYNHAVEAGNSTCDVEKVSVESWSPWFIKHNGSRRPIWVAENPADLAEGVLGYISLSYFMNERPGYFKTSDLGLYVHPKHQSKGVGRFLLRNAMASAPQLGIEVIATTIFAHNEASLKLFRSLGYEQWGYMPDVARVRGKDFDLIMVGRQMS